MERVSGLPFITLEKALRKTKIAAYNMGTRNTTKTIVLPITAVPIFRFFFFRYFGFNNLHQLLECNNSGNEETAKSLKVGVFRAVIRYTFEKRKITAT